MEESLDYCDSFMIVAEFQSNRGKKNIMNVQ